MKKKTSNLRIAIWIIGMLWLLSWIGICLEIFYWHHLTLSLQLNPPPPLPGMPPPKPGMFLITVILFSVVVPCVCLILVLVSVVRKRPSGA